MLVLDSRARVAENLAVQLAGSLTRNDTEAVKETIDTVVGRNKDLLSVGIRDAEGTLAVSSNDHAANWSRSIAQHATTTYLKIPLSVGSKAAGEIEMVFRPYQSSGWGGLSPLLVLIGFVCTAGFVAYYFLIRTALHELDPGRAIPERVKAAFDTLAEGVLIIDQSEFILLANRAFVDAIHGGDESIVGMKIGMLSWTSDEPRGTKPNFPWATALRQQEPVIGVPMGIIAAGNELRQLLVNATSITDANEVVRGVIVTLDDVTLLHDTNEELNRSVAKLQESERRISWQNQQLQLLASTDALTGCLNRRAFLAEAEKRLREAMFDRRPVCVLMVDADHFKGINDRFGHVVGDRVLVGLAETFRQICGEAGAVGRYGGEEFCIVLSGRGGLEVERLAELIRLRVSQQEDWLPARQHVTVSIGLAVGQGEASVDQLIRRADQALYAAKAAGRNRIVAWQDSAVA
jgi:diguanylate cyclase (GGDEF)-like protein